MVQKKGWCKVKCDNCKKRNDCDSGSGRTWPCGSYVPKVVTNGHRIRSSDKRLAKALVSAASDGCPPEMDWDCMKEEDGWDSCEECWLMYLQRSAEGE